MTAAERPTSGRTAHFPTSGGMTRYGAVASDLRQAAGILRARASRSDVDILPQVSDIDLAAAVVAADAWMWLLRTDTFERAGQHGPAAVAALAAAVARAAGHRMYITGTILDDIPVDTHPDSLDAADSYRAWAGDNTPDPGAVLRRTAADLSAGAGGEMTGQERRLTGFAALLEATADI